MVWVVWISNDIVEGDLGTFFEYQVEQVCAPTPTITNMIKGYIPDLETNNLHPGTHLLSRVSTPCVPSRWDFPSESFMTLPRLRM